MSNGDNRNNMEIREMDGVVDGKSQTVSKIIFHFHIFLKKSASELSLYIGWVFGHETHMKLIYKTWNQNFAEIGNKVQRSKENHENVKTKFLVNIFNN